VAATRPGSQALQQAWLTRGPLACLLLPVATLFGVLVLLRRWLHARGALRTESLPVPVIVVGNLIAGGAGKTPTVAAVVAVLRRAGRRPGVIARGYGRQADSEALVHVTPQTPAERSGDEPLLLRLRLGVPVVVGRDRVAAARALLQSHPEVDVLVSDDGLQHLRLPRRLQIVVFDERGAGNGWLLPAGPLREPMPRRVPEHTLVLYNAPKPTTGLPGAIAQRGLRGMVPLADWWAGRPASEAALRDLAARPVVAAAGLAHPQRFFDMLRAAGLTSIDPLPLPDHFDFATLPWPEGTADVVLTEKDAVKLPPGRVGSTRVWVAPLDFALGAAFERELLALLDGAQTRKPDGHPTA
jgi:tetraacyldisaccharide 4'-kinase